MNFEKVFAKYKKYAMTIYTNNQAINLVYIEHIHEIMTQIKLKRIYEDPDSTDGYRILVDRLWPRGMKKEAIHYDLWEKDVTPSAGLRKWFHQSPDERWHEFEAMYKKELNSSEAVTKFVEEIKQHPVVTLLYAAKSKDHNHALILKDYLEHVM